MKPNHFVGDETVRHPLYPQEEFIKQKAMLRILEGSCGVEKNTEERWTYVTYQKDIFREGELELYASVCLRGQVSSIIDSCLLWPFD